MGWDDDYEVIDWGARDDFVERLASHEIGDEYAQYFFDEFIFGDHSDLYREELFNDLADYLFDEYGIDFYDIFDWESFRDWYDGVAS